MHTETASNALALTSADVERLLNDDSADTRINMTDKIASAYNQMPLTVRETMVAEQIFRLLLRDTELRVRVSLAEHLKNSTQIPRDVVMALARDVAEVALPILQFSEILNDDDLMALIRSTEEVERYLAIAQRRMVSDVISDTLLDKGNEAVVSTLVENEGASISDHGYAKIIEDHGANETLMKRLGDRPYLPVAVVEKLVSVVSSSLSQSLKTKYKLEGAQVDKAIDKEVDKTRETETLRLVRVSEKEADIDRLIQQLQLSGRLTPSIILSALCQGNFDFFEMSLAKLSNIPSANARKLINDRGDLGFRAIYNKSGLPDTMFPAVKLLLKIVRELDVEGEKPGSSRYANRIVERILQYSEENNMENLSYIIALVRRVAQ